MGNISSESKGNVFCRVFIDGIEMSDLTVDYLVPGTELVCLVNNPFKVVSIYHTVLISQPGVSSIESIA